jgi:hypothetical protein
MSAMHFLPRKPRCITGDVLAVKSRYGAATMSVKANA